MKKNSKRIPCHCNQPDCFEPVISEAVSINLLKSVRLFMEFLDSLPAGWLGKTCCDIGVLNDAYLTVRPALEEINDN